MFWILLAVEYFTLYKVIEVSQREKNTLVFRLFSIKIINATAAK